MKLKIFKEFCYCDFYIFRPKLSNKAFSVIIFSSNRSERLYFKRKTKKFQGLMIFRLLRVRMTRYRDVKEFTLFFLSSQ